MHNDLLDIFLGVPQGFILGSLLFSFCYRSAFFNNELDYASYAHDTLPNVCKTFWNIILRIFRKLANSDKTYLMK